MNGCAPTPIASSGCSSATPRLSFGALNGGAPLAADKRSTAGVMRRLTLARHEFPDAEELAAAKWSSKQADLSDLLDAYAALSTALRCGRGEHHELGDGERDAHASSCGWRSEPDAGDHSASSVAPGMRWSRWERTSAVPRAPVPTWSLREHPEGSPWCSRLAGGRSSPRDGSPRPRPGGRYVLTSSGVRRG